ncbi:hypothetical protein [Brevundimonas sp.]|uniref:hypothetical protein n=1 Tax=Brevundimonas sp. TaxID=1871086 RepID=UPI003566FEDE
MIDLRPITDGYSRQEVTDAVYYAIRFVKQGAAARQAGKDVFQDARRSTPTPRTRDLTMSLVHELESALGRQELQFQDGDFQKSVGALSSLTERSTESMTDADRAEAEALAEELSFDPTQSNSDALIG